MQESALQVSVIGELSVKIMPLRHKKKFARGLLSMIK